RQHGARLLEEQRALARELHSGRGPQEQLHSDFVFELADVPAERRLRDVELSRRFGEAVRVGDGGEGPQMTQIHERLEGFMRTGIRRRPTATRTPRHSYVGSGLTRIVNRSA